MQWTFAVYGEKQTNGRHGFLSPQVNPLSSRGGNLRGFTLEGRITGGGSTHKSNEVKDVLEPAGLFVDAHVAFDREMLVAAEVRIVLAGGDDGVEIAFDAGG